MSTPPTCPQCGGSGVRAEQITVEGVVRLIWVCERDHRFPG